MALDTIPTPISHDTVTKYLTKLDDRGETYDFVAGATTVRAGKIDTLPLTLHRNGDEDCLEVVLNMNGTWTASHVLVIGEKE